MTYDLIVKSATSGVPGATRRCLGGPFLLGLSCDTAAQFECERLCHAALAARLAFGTRESLCQLDDTLLLHTLVFPVLLADVRQFAADSLQIHSRLVHLRMGSVFDRPNMLLPMVVFPGSSCFDHLNLLP